MVGLRGVGKTVLLDRMRDDAEASGITTVRIEAPEGRSLPAMLAPQLRQALLRLSRSRQGEGSGSARVAGTGRLREGAEGQIPGYRGRHRFRTGARSRRQRRPGERSCRRCSSSAAMPRRPAETALGLFIDELQYVEEDQLAALITALHRTAQRSLAGRAGRSGTAAIAGPHGPRQVIRRAAVRLSDGRPAVGRCGPDRHREARAATRGVGITDDALHRIFEETHGYPYFLQEWGKHTWDAAEGSPMTLQDVELASTTAVAALDESFFRVRFDRLTPLEKRYLRAMAQLGPGPASLRRYRLGAQPRSDVARPDAKPVDLEGNDLEPEPRRYGVHRAAVRSIHAPDHAGRRLEAITPAATACEPRDRTHHDGSALR